MEFIFVDLLTKRVWCWIALVIAVVLLVAAFANPQLSGIPRALLVFGSYVAFCLFLIPSILEAAHKDHTHLLTVCLWSFVAVVLGVVVIFFTFLSVFDGASRYDRLLNVVPVFVAIWAAALGWLINFRIRQKAHRTNNAFAIIMETRKSSEFRSRMEVLAKHFPPGSKTITDDYVSFFCPLRVAEVLSKEESAAAAKDKTLAEAILALKYILNYYEFMAVGIRVGDLDEKIIYDTINPTVCNLYERSLPLINYLRDRNNPGGDPTTYCDLKDLVDRWNQWRREADAKPSS